jgi:hypothetical protein
MTSRRATALLAALALVILAAGCGRDPDQVSSEGADEDEQAAPAATAAPATGPSAAAGLDEGAFGDLGTVCSAGSGEPQPLAGETGLDGTTIRVGTIADPGSSFRPGLNQEMFDIADAFVKWCNEHGGVRGYQLALDKLVAALFEYQARVVDACSRDWFLVGGGGTFDGDGQAQRLQCGLPDIAAFVVTPPAIGADLTVQPVPLSNESEQYGIFKWLERKYPDAVGHMMAMTGAIDTTRVIAKRHVEATESLGWKFAAQIQEYNPQGEASWSPFVQRMKDKRVRGLIYAGEPANLVKLEQAMHNLGFEPDFVFMDANVYDAEFIRQGANQIVPTYTYLYFYPFEDASENATGATQQYLDLLAAGGGGKRALLGMQGLSAWLLFAKSLGECADAGTVTRDCVFGKARSTTAWTGGGLHAEMNPSTGDAPSCFTAVEATPDGFVTQDVDATDGIFNCAPGNVFRFAGPYGEGAKCPSGRADPLPSQCT